jgi:hypothetical protein
MNLLGFTHTRRISRARLDASNLVKQCHTTTDRSCPDLADQTTSRPEEGLDPRTLAASLPRYHPPLPPRSHTAPPRCSLSLASGVAPLLLAHGRQRCRPRPRGAAGSRASPARARANTPPMLSLAQGSAGVHQRSLRPSCARRARQGHGCVLHPGPRVQTGPVLIRVEASLKSRSDWGLQTIWRGPTRVHASSDVVPPTHGYVTTRHQQDAWVKHSR